MDIRSTLKILLLAASIVVITLIRTQAFAQDSNSKGDGDNRLRLRNLTAGEIDKPINVEGLTPGAWTGWGEAELSVTGQPDLKVYFHLENLNGSACEKTNIQLVTETFGRQKQKQSDLYQGPITRLNGSDNRIMVYSELEHGMKLKLRQRIQLDASADHSYRNTTCSWDEIFTGSPSD